MADDYDSDFDEPLENLDQMNLNIGAFRRERVIRPRTDLYNQFGDHQFRLRYRLPRNVVLQVLQEIGDELPPPPVKQTNFPLSPMNRLLICLRFYATGTFQAVLGDLVGVHKSTVSRTVRQVSRAIAMLRPRYIQFPETPAQQATVKQGFYNLGGGAIVPMPGALGTIDCSHVPISSPGGDNAEIFRNRKSYFSINVQSISDAKLRFMNIVARWHGSAHDSTIFANSRIAAKFLSNEYPNSHLLGDGGYRLSRIMLTPLLDPATPAERRYNRSHIRTRNTVERKYGVWKKRFPCLQMKLRTKLRTSCSVVIATAVLHNMCINIGDENPPPIDPDLIIPPYEQPEVVNDRIAAERRVQYAPGAKRRALISTVFTTNRTADQMLLDQHAEVIEYMEEE